ncbi:MAG: LuxR C-terminal-related transcriptional regulator [Actinobacteria bacterium]|nr:LuxR C-terminal-related transcriptional regulator [Actinomycetota bacterium]
MPRLAPRSPRGSSRSPVSPRAASRTREIAARLFLSPRTVENKLHACYRQARAQGRADLAHALETY